MNLRRSLLKLLAAAGVFGPAGVTGLIRDALALGNDPVPPGLHKAKGDVRINGKPAAVGTLIKPGDTVSTGPGSEAIYVIGQDAFLQRDNSTVSFAAEATKEFMRVVTGRLLSVFGRGDKRITVSTATVGIRGTGCYIEDEPYKDGRRTYFCLCYGTVDLQPTAAPQERETYSTRHHEKPMYVFDDMKMPKMMVPANVINHTDIELTMLENLVGRWPPFHGSGVKY
jgi:hypothetical protein